MESLDRIFYLYSLTIILLMRLERGWLKSVNPTPVIDKLANEGMIFVNSFAQIQFVGQIVL